MSRLFTLLAILYIIQFILSLLYTLTHTPFPQGVSVLCWLEAVLIWADILIMWWRRSWTR